MVRWIPAGRFVRVTASGPVTTEEQFAAVRAAASGTSLTRALYDARDMTAQADSPRDEEMREYAVRIAALGYRRYALVVGPARMPITTTFARLCAESGIDAEVFEEIDDATRWLEREEPPASPSAA